MHEVQQAVHDAEEEEQASGRDDSTGGVGRGRGQECYWHVVLAGLWAGWLGWTAAKESVDFAVRACFARNLFHAHTL